ncbi:hypothetical protein LTR09_007268 [Extremus antarcticus]|uniref:G-patch domain-containing protein n=1 Tax=Extremus antarcticus TaxID=702011 RepID=A0AAJ0DJJ2_9PEZI|nr:hypothetical protein LTR09_007268 [Extremus antarcticus]
MSQKRSYAAFQSQQSQIPSGPPSHAPFALHGTPLPAYNAESRDDGSYVPIWKQEVTDERGRKRLHGAFTGGFSAGYFNSVGSKEGWTPATFVSSRRDKAKQRKDGGAAQRVEDFMDEEDLAERAEGQRIETKGGFAGLGGVGDENGGAEGGMFADLFRATGETMGVKLLQRMGWRVGQGIGPKVRRKAKGDEKGEVHLFAPENSRTVGLRKKVDRKGLGFAGEEKLEGGGEGQKEDDEDVDSDRDARMMPSNRSKVLVKPKQKIKKTGIGIGVLNDTGSDDEDAYDMGPRISYSRIIGGDKKKKKKGLLTTNANPTVQQKAVFTPSKNLAQRTSTLAGFRKCHDGRLPLDGFVLTTAPLALLQENKHPPPPVPEGWKPSRVSQPTTATDPSTTHNPTDTPSLNPTTRAAILGEQPLPGKSIFSFLTPAARDHLASASNRSDLPPALSEKAPAGFESSEARNPWDLIPDLDSRTAESALQRLNAPTTNTSSIPYAEDEAKQSRYRAFLSLRAGLSTDLPPRPAGLRTDDWARELAEFKRAADVFGPMSNVMGARFTTSAAKTFEGGPAETKMEKPEDPAEKAAKMGMFGPLTRSTLPFYPTRLLCKRFNVKVPASVAGGADKDASGEGKRGEGSGMPGLDKMMREGGYKPSGFVSGGLEGGNMPTETLVTRDKEKEKVVDVEKNDALEGQRAGEAVFKAIFGSEDEDEDG